MVTVKFVGKTCMILNGQFIYRNETREIDESLFERMERERPGMLVIAGAESAVLPSPDSAIAIDDARYSEQIADGLQVKEVTDGDSTERVEQPPAERRSGAKRRAQ